MNKEKLLKYAIDYLSKYDSSKKNLLNVLKRKIFRFDGSKLEKKLLFDDLENIVNKLETNNLINDKRFGMSKFSQLSRMGKSKNFIFNYLIKKGMNKFEIEDILEEFQKNNSDWEMNAARLFAKKKKLLESKDAHEKKLAKMARAGFSYDICKKILN